MSSPAGFERNYYGVKQPQGFPGIPDSWFTEWETRLAADNATKLFALVHQKRDTPVKRVLVIVHGYGEHSGRYLHFPHYLDATRSGIDVVFAYDQRGHGRSEGLRGDVDRFDSFADDLDGMLRHVETRYPGAEIHLLGHSFGGHVVLRFGFLHPGLPLKTFQASSPFLALHQEPPLPLRAVAKLLSKTWSTLSLTSDVDPSVLSRDERVVENYQSDRLNHGRMTPRFYASMVETQKDTLSRHSGFAYPLVVHLPLADRLVNSPVTRKFFDSLDNAGKRIFEYPEFRHESMNELGKEVFFEKPFIGDFRGGLRRVMGSSDSVQHVSDTSFWIAAYRARETARADALFRDPLAEVLAEGRGEKIAAKIGSREVMAWVVALRTVIIDEYIRESLARGVDTILNLGAGLDTRPYRLELPENLRWIEVDFPDVITYKTLRLGGEPPKCDLERISLDLSNAEERERLFEKIAARAGRVLVLTEGVIPYLSNDEASALAADLVAQRNFKYWVTDYFSEKIMRRATRGRISRKLGANAQFRFAPENWERFFSGLGWRIGEMKYLYDEGMRVGRPPPIPWYIRPFIHLFPKRKRLEMARMNGYALLERKIP